MIKIHPFNLAVIVCFAVLALSSATASLKQDPIQGLWVWRFEWIATPESREELLGFCEKHGYNLVLMQVHLDDNSGTPVFRDPVAMRKLVIDAAARGIAVEALNGEKSMALEENWPRTLAILDAILTFNETLPDNAKLAGVHYDIEPYLLPEWKEGGEKRLKIMEDLLAFYVLAKAKIERQGMALACDIPFWFDEKVSEGDSCILEFNSETKNLHQHIQDLCDYVGIMSYRRHATGNNSVTQHVESELAYAEKIGKLVMTALETVELKDVPQITFYGQPEEDFWNTQAEVIEALKDRPGFGGMLTHCWSGMREMMEIGKTESATK